MVSAQVSRDEGPHAASRAFRAEAAPASDPDLGARLRGFVLAELQEA